MIEIKAIFVKRPPVLEGLIFSSMFLTLEIIPHMKIHSKSKASPQYMVRSL